MSTKKPARETVFVSFQNPDFPEYDCGVTFNIPENLNRPIPELRKVFRMILTSGTEEDIQTVESCLSYEIGIRKESAFKASEKKAIEKLEARRRLWYKLAGKELPDDEAAVKEDTAASTADAANNTSNAAASTSTSRKAERKIDMFNFFENCADVEAARKRYYKLAQVYHTDTGAGDDETMKIINDQFSAFIGKNDAAAASILELPAGVIALPEHCETPAAVDEAAEYMDVIAALLNIPGINVEICGTWLWVSGDTKAVKDQIKAAGLRFSGGKKMWYWRPAAQAGHRHYRGSKSMGYIRGKYGSRTLMNDEKSA